MTGVAATARRLAGVASSDSLPQPARFLATPPVAAGLAALAAMELVADKLPFLPNRTEPGPLLGRVVAGGVIGAAIAATARRDRASGAIVGAAAAFAGAHVGFHFRRELAARLPATVAALVEDAVVGAVTTAGVSAMTRAEIT